ncbi:uncharacterized protein LODBEIA_P33970 [Lodderomyces beijingensis]|uniref:Bacterial surface antigen (D15) domain-containing protein n=1 Tax=Lodderomyces beijingensis TaxID=1775926 RepID=A0ABP0ZLZ6_9ASCO
MSIVSQDEEFMESISRPNPSFNTSLTDAEKQLSELQSRKQTQLVEQNQQYLEQLFMENATQPIKIRNVQLTNAQHFRDSFIEAQFRPLLSGHVLSLENYLSRVDDVSKNFQKMSVVDQILCNTHQVNAPSTRSMDFAGLRKPMAAATVTGGAINIVPVFNIIPVKRFFAKTGTNIGNGEGDGFIQFQLRNIFGGGENLVFDAVTGTKTSSSYLVNYNQPVLNNANYIWETAISINSRKFDWIQSNVMSKSFTNKLYTQFHDSKWNCEVVVENSVRNLSNYASKSYEVMQQGGQSIKSSIGYNVHYDTRDNKHLPFAGRFFQFGVEYNGLFPKWNRFPYVKTASQVQQAWSLPLLNSHLLTSCKFGLLYPLTSQNSSRTQSSSILDRFFIGGPNDVRSFSLNGLGPRDQNSFVGGDLFLNGGVSLFTNIPRYADSNFKIHNFLNWGKIVTLDRQVGLAENFKKLSQSHCLSYGFGILYNHPMARFELNFVLPLIANEGDSIRKGIQYGIGVSFL